jgi:hypothetical protein
LWLFCEFPGWDLDWECDFDPEAGFVPVGWVVVDE